MSNWLTKLKYNPLQTLLNCNNKAIELFTKRDLLDEHPKVEVLWEQAEVQKILRKQKANGSWEYPKGKAQVRSKENYDQIETYRNLGVLIEEYGLDKRHEAIQKAAKFLFKFQTAEGDFRGIYGNQYTPNYSAAITELLIKAGYIDDERIKKQFSWLLAIRQNDGGWAIPVRTRNYNLEVIENNSKTITTDIIKPFSHLITGVVLRAFAAHPELKKSKAALQAGKLLVDSLFKRDKYPDRGTPDFWVGFTYPFWFTDLISALDSISLLGFSDQEPQIQKALNWFIERQQKDGLWDLRILKGRTKEITKLWLSLAVCRIFKRFYK